MKHGESNSLKSAKGNLLNKKVKNKLEMFQSRGIIASYRSEPEYPHPNYIIKQYRPDFEIQISEHRFIIIDNTTTIRNDRLKIKQWEAFGVKAHFESIGAYSDYFVTVPDLHELGNENTNQKEIHHLILGREKTDKRHYFSAVDGILTFSELFPYLESIKK